MGPRGCPPPCMGPAIPAPGPPLGAFVQSLPQGPGWCPVPVTKAVGDERGPPPPVMNCLPLSRVLGSVGLFSAERNAVISYSANVLCPLSRASEGTEKTREFTGKGRCSGQQGYPGEGSVEIPHVRIILLLFPINAAVRRGSLLRVGRGNWASRCRLPAQTRAGHSQTPLSPEHVRRRERPPLQEEGRSPMGRLGQTLRVGQKGPCRGSHVGGYFAQFWLSDRLNEAALHRTGDADPRDGGCAPSRCSAAAGLGALRPASSHGQTRHLQSHNAR